MKGYGIAWAYVAGPWEDEQAIDAFWTKRDVACFGGSDSVVLLSILHDEPEMLEGSTQQVSFGVNGRTGKPLTPTEMFAAWLSFARSVRAQVNPDGFAFAVTQAVLDSAEALDGMRMHGQDLPDSSQGPLNAGDVFEAKGGSYIVVGQHPQSGDILVRWRPAQ